MELTVLPKLGTSPEDTKVIIPTPFFITNFPGPLSK